MKDEPDKLSRRCPRLGGPVEFSYCRICGENRTPCFKIFDCWWEIFDVVSYLKENLPKDQFDEISKRKPKSKVADIVELIREIQKDQQRK